MIITFNIPTYKKIVVVETKSDDLTIGVMAELLKKGLRLVGYTKKTISQVLKKDKENGTTKCNTEVSKYRTG